MARGAYKKRRQAKEFDPLLHPNTSANRIAVDVALAPFDRWVQYLNVKWGVDRVEQFQSAEMLERYGQALGALNEAIQAEDAAQVRHCAEDCIRGMMKMDEIATAAGAPEADGTYWEFQVNDIKAAIVADEAAWPRVRQERPDLEIILLREVGVFYAHWRETRLGEMVVKAKESFPNATVTKVKAGDVYDDPIPF